MHATISAERYQLTQQQDTRNLKSASLPRNQCHDVCRRLNRPLSRIIPQISVLWAEYNPGVEDPVTELSGIASNEFRDRDTLVDKELRTPGGVGDRSGHRVNADVVIYRCHNFLHINGTVHCMFTQTIG